jgi:hypothetical protein
MAPRRAVAAVVNEATPVRVLVAFVLSLAVIAGTRAALSADSEPPLSDAEILGPTSMTLRLESVTARLSAYNQFGAGYQSKSGPVLGPGSERLTIFEPQTEVVLTQGDRITHRVWIPVDVISEASAASIPKPVDLISGASRKAAAGAVSWTTTVRTNPVTLLTMTSGSHVESTLRSWNEGLGASRSFADQNTVVSGSVVGIQDWLDRFLVTGERNGRTGRSTTMGSAGVTQILTPTTVVNVNYGLTLQQGTLGNTWNAVPLTNDTRGPELLPTQRLRHAVVGRMAQFLPWNGALRLYYRFYADDWGIVAHSAEGQIMQRLTPMLYVGAIYRFHTQTGPTFFTTLASPDATLRVADSDLAPLQSQTIGGKFVGDAPFRAGGIRSLHYEVEYDRYVRTNDLRMDILTCSIGLHF